MTVLKSHSINSINFVGVIYRLFCLSIADLLLLEIPHKLFSFACLVVDILPDFGCAVESPLVDKGV